MTSQDDADRARRKALAGTFDRLVESNLQLVQTVRVALVIVSACAVVSLSWSAWSTYSMRGTILEIRALVTQLLASKGGTP